MIERAGHAIVTDAAEADIAVFNSCAVTAEAEADLRQAVRRAAKSRAGLRSVIMGCASAIPDRHDALSLRGLPSVERLVAGGDLTALAAALSLPRDASVVRAAAQTSVRALLRVQDGCDEHCTFCATTLARGNNRSRPADEIVTEACALAEHHEEIVITGIHIGSYGLDAGSSLGELIERLVRDVPRVRFRLSSLEATEVDERLLALLVEEPARVAPHLHAPLQSGSDVVLKRMGRHWYTADRYARVVERLASRRIASRPRTHRRAGRAIAVHISARLSVLIAPRHGRRAFGRDGARCDRLATRTRATGDRGPKGGSVSSLP